MSFGFGPSGCCCHHKSGCEYFQDALIGHGGLGHNYSGSSGTRTTSGTVITGGGAQVMCRVLRPHGAGTVNVAVFVVAHADGDTARLHFNGGWIAEMVFGTSPLVRILNGGGEVMCSHNFSFTGYSSTLVLSYGPDTNSVWFTAAAGMVSAYCPYASSAVGFGTGSNASGMTFSGFSLGSCGTPLCHGSLTRQSQLRVQGLTWTLTSGGIVTEDPNHWLRCTDCGRMNSTVVVPWVNGDCGTAYFYYEENQTACDSTPEFPTAFGFNAWVTMAGNGGCGVNIGILLQYGWLSATYAFSKAATVDYVDLDDLSNVNAAIAAAPLGGGPGAGLFCQGTPASLEAVLS